VIRNLQVFSLWILNHKNCEFLELNALDRDASLAQNRRKYNVIASRSSKIPAANN